MFSIKTNFKIKMKLKWLFYSITGLLLCGFGLSLLGEAIIFKIEKNFDWFYLGTLALVVFNSGICLVGKAIIVRIEIKRQR